MILDRLYEPVIVPAKPMPLQDSVVFHSGFSAQFSHGALRAILLGHESVVAHIIRLLAGRRPAAILWFVIAVCINAIKTMLLRRRTSHIRQEGFIAIQPSAANSNPTSPIDWIFPLCFAIAPGFHAKPSTIFFRGPMSFAVRSLSGTGLLQKAAAALSATGFERAALHKASFPAIALTMPAQESTAIAVGSLPDDREKTEALASQIDFLHS